MDELWIKSETVKATYIGSDAEPGIYLGIDLNFKRIWVTDSEPKACIFLDHEFEVAAPDDSAAVFLGAVEIVVEPTGFNHDGLRGATRRGSLIFEGNRVFLMGGRGHSFARKVLVGISREGGGYSYPISCGKWGLVMKDHEGEYRPAFEFSGNPEDTAGS